MNWTKYIAEAVGTFMLVLIGAGSVVFHEEVFAIGDFGIALAFGGIVFLMILAFGKLSGAHINPAVSFSFWAAGKLARKDLIGFVFFQVAGAIMAAAVLHGIFPQNANLGSTLPGLAYPSSTHLLWKYCSLSYSWRSFSSPHQQSRLRCRSWLWPLAPQLV